MNTEPTARNTTVAVAKAATDRVVMTIMAVCLRRRSTKVPKTGPSTAAEMLNAPAMQPVATTDRDSRYTQNVRANHRNELVTEVTSVLASSWRNAAGTLSAAWARGAVVVSIGCTSSTGRRPLPGDLIAHTRTGR